MTQPSNTPRPGRPNLGRVPATGRAGRLLRMTWSTLRFDQAMLHRAPCRVSALRVTIPHAYAPAALRTPSGLAFPLPPALPSGKGASRPLSSWVQDRRPSAFFPAPMTGASGRFNPRQWFATPLSSPGRGSSRAAASGSAIDPALRLKIGDKNLLTAIDIEGEYRHNLFIGWQMRQPIPGTMRRQPRPVLSNLCRRTRNERI